jgi:hypothetical protein
VAQATQSQAPKVQPAQPQAPQIQPAAITQALGIEELDVAARKVFAPLLKTPDPAQAAAGQPALKWYQRRSWQIGVAVFGVLVGLGGLTEVPYGTEEAFMLVVALLAVNVLAVWQRWTWLLYTCGVFNCLLALIMAVGTAGASSDGQEEFYGAYCGAFIIELYAIYQTIRSKRQEGKL